MRTYDAQEIEQKITAALGRVRTVLDNTRNPKAPADVPHSYDDKYRLAEFVARVSIASLLQSLELVGLTGARLHELQEWAKTRQVTLRLTAHESCRLLREESRKVESPNELVTETRGILGKRTTTQKIVTTVTEWFWAFDFSYEIVAFKGSDPDASVTLFARTGSAELKTAAKEAPRPASVARPALDVSLTWLLSQLDADGRASFTIDRADAACHTPRRNPEVDAALQAAAEIHDFCERVIAYFNRDLFPAQEGHHLDLDAINDREIFIPVVPLFEDGARSEGEGRLPASYADAFLAEERRSLVDKLSALATSFPKDGSAITATEVGLVVTMMHAKHVCEHLAGGVAYIEAMLQRQLVAAIGKELSVTDFNAFMQFHHNKLVKPEYRPKPFSYAIRRPDHSPEGVLSLEATGMGSMPEPISTTVARRDRGTPMTFALDASTRVSFTGERFLHGWIGHQFSGQSGLSLQLVARARQFSSFILLVGRVSSATTFEPRFGIIVQNKDLLTIPIMLEQIPTPKEFRDAIESLSPEQQRFARAFRGMQLESTLFGVCVIQIKPQLEKLLKLPEDSLTKEIKLTQELLSLFIEYQIPSDLLSFDGEPDAPTDAKLTRVREYVGRMREMIDLSKQREIEEEREREALRLAEQNRSYAQETGGGGYRGGDEDLAASMPRSVSRSGSARAPRAAAPLMLGGPPGAGGPPPMPMPMMAMPMSAAAVGAAAPQAPKGGPAPPAPQATATAPVPTAPRPRDGAEAAPSTSQGEGIDYTRIPGELDKKLEALDEDAALRATILTPDDPWTRLSQKGLLSAAKGTFLHTSDLTLEKNKAFDLLDALTRSGALGIEDASLHVVIAATHCFDRTLTETVIQENVNPIEKVERSLVILATTIHGAPASQILADDQRDRFLAGSPLLGPAS